MTCLQLQFLMALAALSCVGTVQTRSSSLVPDFITAPIAPQQFLMVSSPSEKKVVWTTLQNFESTDGRPFSLIDTGLDEPKGLAFDHERGHLYVADSGAKKIFRYTVLADLSGEAPVLSTSGVRLTITQGHPVEWVTTDHAGNLYYTAPDTNNINKIPAEVMDNIAKGTFAPSTLQIVSEKTLEAKQIAAAALKKSSVNSGDALLPHDPPAVEPLIYSMYEAAHNPHVSAPAAVWTDGPDLYWTNQKEGKTAGTVVRGHTHPKSGSTKSGPGVFPAVAITNVSSGAFACAKAHNVMFFTQNGTTPGSGLVTGLLLDTEIVIDFVNNLATPRGLVWDYDQTMYVADSSSGNVYSFPTGRMMAHVPITKTVSMKGAYGLVLLSTRDRAFAKNEVDTNGQTAAEDAMAAQSAQISKATKGNAALIDVSLFTRSNALGEQGPAAVVVILGAMATMFAMPA